MQAYLDKLEIYLNEIGCSLVEMLPVIFLALK